MGINNINDNPLIGIKNKIEKLEQFLKDSGIKIEDINKYKN